MELLLELRDLVHDHLGTRGMLYDLRPGVEQRRSDRDLMGLADHLPPDPHRRGLDVGARLGYPTAGGPYWWAARLGGPAWSWFTGWFNVIGLLAVVASVDYAAATFGSTLFNLWGLDLGVINFADDVQLDEVFAVFVVLLVLHALINIYSSHLVALFNNISVFWHVVGVAVIIGILIIVPDHHQSADFVFTETFNNSGFDGGSTTSLFFWGYVLPVGFLLTMYTVTGYDASAHVAEETKDAEMAAAKGVWQSVFFSAIIGWFVLLAITFAATRHQGDRRAGGYARRPSSRARCPRAGPRR